MPVLQARRLLIVPLAESHLLQNSSVILLTLLGNFPLLLPLLLQYLIRYLVQGLLLCPFSSLSVSLPIDSFSPLS
jgi:hypothetical protein